jgi:hypothetical protein
MHALKKHSLLSIILSLPVIRKEWVKLKGGIVQVLLCASDHIGALATANIQLKIANFRGKRIKKCAKQLKEKAFSAKRLKVINDVCIGL